MFYPEDQCVGVKFKHMEHAFPNQNVHKLNVYWPPELGLTGHHGRVTNQCGFSINKPIYIGTFFRKDKNISSATPFHTQITFVNWSVA